MKCRFDVSYAIEAALPAEVCLKVEMKMGELLVLNDLLYCNEGGFLFITEVKPAYILMPG